MKQWKKIRQSGWKRVSACVLSVAMLMGTTSWFPAPQAEAASYQQPYLDKMVAWGFMRGDLDGNLNPDNPITRAEYVSIINRALGYEQMGGTPFKDVTSSDWFAEDVDIAYTEGYVAGTSNNTFSPNDSVNREQAVVMLARNLMLQPAVGENTDFTDSREMSDWSRGLITTATAYQMINGYPDGTFRPKDSITRGEAAILITNTVGTPLQEAGTYTLGHTWGNVTITSSGVTLRDTVIAGNLYITDGVDLGQVLLENVTVLGEILVSGGGVSESGDDSIILRNVTAPKLILDNIDNQQVSVRVQGTSDIDVASVRTNAFVVDNSGEGQGISRIELDGEDGLEMTLSGNVKEVINYTPESTINVASGQVDTITVDEKAVDSTLNIVAGAEVDKVNLDVATVVTGNGDIGQLTVNAPGSTVSMLPDQIIIRPGITANINGEVMDSAAAAEASADPRLQAGYPNISDLAPTSATAEFKANKKGTVYWAITAVTDGSVGAEDLIHPSSYMPKIVQQGTVSLTDSSQVETANISKLTSNGSYYLSAVFVDGREDRSPLKVISFTTPDDTKPDFASGYPYMSKITNISGQVTAMTTKTCRLYYAVLPKGAAAPTAEDFKANAVTGNLGFGTLDVTKNTPYTFEANNVPLEELETYDLYLWLTDVDGAQSSSVKKLTFTTVDRTPPIFNTEPTVNSVKETSVGLYANLNEAGTLYWVVVNQGEIYPKPLAGQSGAVDLASEEAKMQVMAGMNALKSGKTNMTEGQDVTFNVSGLEPEKAYDLYYVAQDKAGNFSDRVGKITIHTLDPNAPTVTQEFTKYNGTDTSAPLADTDIRLVFSEAVQTVSTNTPLVDLYQAVVDANGTAGEGPAREAMAAALRDSIYLYSVSTGSRPEQVIDGNDKEGWTIDYRYAVIKLEDGKTVVTFPNGQGLNLKSGAEYYFEIQADTLADTSSAMNVMGRTQLDNFRTIFATVYLSNPNESTLEGTITDLEDQEVTLDDQGRLIDISWLLTPATTERVEDNINWDMIIWSDTSVAFDLYRRTNTAQSDGQWQRIGNNIELFVADGDDRRGISLTKILHPGNNPPFEKLKELEEDKEYEYAIHFTRVEDLTDRDTWSQRINMGITIVAGSTDILGTLANGRLDSASLENALEEGANNIGSPTDFTLRKQYSDQTPPVFVDNRPYFEKGDSMVNMFLMLDRPGTIYYVIAPMGTMTTEGVDADGKKYNFSTVIDDYNMLPERGENDPTTGEMKYAFELTSPTALSIINASNQSNSRIKYGSVQGNATEIEKLVEDLEVKTDYIAYFVIQGVSSQVYSPVYAYRFSTEDVVPAYITMRAVNPEVEFTTSQDANLYYALYPSNKLPSLFTTKKLDEDNLAEEYKADPPDGVTDLTLLQAIQKTYDGITGESYFDHYASSTIKEEVRLAITSQTSSDALDKGTLSNMQQKVPQEHDFTNAMNPNSATAYLCLATAQNRLGGIWSFKAVDGVRIPDEEPPILMNVDTSASFNGSTISGTVMLSFSEDIYHINSEGDPSSLRPIVQWPLNEDDRVGFLELVSKSQYLKLSYSQQSAQVTRTITLSFENASVGDFFSFCSTGYLADASSNSSKEDSYYTLQLQKTDDIGLIPGANDYDFVVTQGNYAGD